MKNIKEYMPKHFDVETPMKGVKAGTGTFKEILDGVLSDKIYPLTYADGTVVGLGYDTGKSGAEDSMEQRIFERKYSGIDVMSYFEKAFEIKMAGKAVTEVEETNRYIAVHYVDGTEEVLYGRKDCRCAERDEDVEISDDKPSEVLIDADELGEPTDSAIKKYLRNKYGRYLSGDADEKFKAELVEEGDKMVWKVTDIKWGRKID